jgi:predicted enzyme related to lactoylglutathione lyase
MTSDVDRSRAFYTSLFGWGFEEGGEEYGGYSTFTLDGVPVGGCMGAQPGQEMADFWSIYLHAADAQATVDRAVAHGGSVMLPPMRVMALGTMAVLGDAGGAGICVWQPAEHHGFGVIGEPGAPSWFELHTREYEKSLRFYEDVFGWDVHVVGDTDEFRYATLGEGDAQEAGVMDASAWLPEGVPNHWSIYFGTADTDATLARAVELGGAVVQPAEDTPYGRLATASDATGSVFKLVQPPQG